MDNLKRKKISRGVYRSHIKALEKEINGLIEKGVQESDAVKLQSLKSNFKRKIEKLEETDNEILNLIKEEEEYE